MRGSGLSMFTSFVAVWYCVQIAWVVLPSSQLAGGKGDRLRNKSALAQARQG